MAFYKLPRLQKNSGDFSALPLPLQSCASPWPLQGRTAPSRRISGADLRSARTWPYRFMAASWRALWRYLGVSGAYVGWWGCTVRARPLWNIAGWYGSSTKPRSHRPDHGRTVKSEEESARGHSALGPVWIYPVGGQSVVHFRSQQGMSCCFCE